MSQYVSVSKLDQIRALGLATRQAKQRRVSNPFEDAARGRDPVLSKVHRPAKGGPHEVTKSPPKQKMVDVVYERHVKHGTDGLETKGDTSLAKRGPDAQNIGPLNSKRGGRPLAKDADKALSRTKPWEGEGMSRASWYRRRAEQKGTQK